MSLHQHKNIDGIESPLEQAATQPPHKTPLDQHKVDLTRKKPTTPAVHSVRRHRVRNGVLIALLIVGIGLIGFGIYAYQLTKNQIVEKDDQANFFQQVHRIVDNDSEPLKGEEEDRINIALFGIGGEGHEGGQLADTIMVASIKPSTNQVALISIPRDLNVAFYAPNSNYPEYHKINSAIFRAGNDGAVDVVSDVTGLDTHYYVVADFEGFRDVINTLGGIDIDVETAFTDYQYPDYNYGYQTIRFAQGVQHMDGETALQYARSRKGNNGEGSDFKRAVRQQKVLEAVKEEALSSSTYLNPVTVTQLLQNVGDHIATNAEAWEMVRFAEIAQKIEREKIINSVITNDSDGLVYEDTTNGYNLIPNLGLGKYAEIHEMALEIFDSAVEEAEQEEQTASAKTEDAVIVVQNGTTITGLAGTTAENLSAEGVNVSHVGNAVARNVAETVIYDLTNGAKPATLTLLEEETGGESENATLPASDSAVRLATDVDSSIVDLSTVPEDVDFIVLLGTDAAGTNPTN